MNIAFFLRAGDAAVPPEPPLPEGMTLRLWRPNDKSGRDPLRIGVKIQHLLSLYDDDRYTEIGIWFEGTRLHRLIVTPRWHRFPFMDRGDLQIGGVWTHPAWRRRGLASLSVHCAHRLFAAPGQRLWYVTDSANGASIALAKGSGYRPAGEGRRTKPLGIALVGQYRLDRRYTLA